MCDGEPQNLALYLQIDDGKKHYNPFWLENAPFLQKHEGSPLRYAIHWQRQIIFERDGGVCHYCGEVVTLEKFHADHKQAYAKGGLTAIDNLVCACRQCNLAKGAEEYEDFVSNLAKNGLVWRNRVATTQANYFREQDQLAFGS